MRASGLSALSALQQVKFERAAQAYQALSAAEAELRYQISEIRAGGQMVDADPADAMVGQKYLSWRNEKLRELNIRLARHLAKMEAAKSALRREFGRKLALSALEDR